MLKLKARITLLLMPLILVPVVIAGIYAYQERTGSYLDNIDQTLSAESSRAAANIRDRIDSAAGNLELLSHSSLIRLYFTEPREDRRFLLYYRPIMELFKSYQRTFPAYVSLQMFDARGDELLRLQDHSNPYQAPARLPIEDFVKGVIPEDKRVSVTGSGVDNPVLQVTKVLSRNTFSGFRIAGPDEINGYLRISVSLRDAAERLAMMRVDQTGFITLADGLGEILYPDLAPGQDNIDLVVRQQVLTGGLDIPSEQRYLAASEQIMEGLHVVTLWPKSDLTDRTHQLARNLVAIISGLALLMALLIFLFIHRELIRPLVGLTHYARQLKRQQEPTEEGQPRSRPEPDRKIKRALKRQDEVGELARAYRDLDRSLRASNKRLSFIAYHDSLTGLANRHTFNTFLHKTIAAAERHEYKVALLYIDIDGFKEVNDSLGHESGDDVLKEIAERMHSVLRVEDLVADMADFLDLTGATKISRIGGDEFAIVISHLDSTLHAGNIARRLVEVMEPPFVLENHQFLLGASIGVAVYPDNGRGAQDLLKCADIAMYHSKRKGRNGFEYYDQKMDAQATERYQIMQELGLAVAENQLELHYQPQLRLDGNAQICCEALLRWRHPTRGYVSPAVFIPIAEDSGLIFELGEYVIREVCRQWKAWCEEDIAPNKIAINISPIQFSASTSISAKLQEILSETGLTGEFLEVELTETDMMQSEKVNLAELSAIKALQIGIAMDDFGTGYSSLASLRDLPIDRLKIDKSFVDRIENDIQGQAIIKAITALAQELDLAIVAEGVETEDQLSFLRAQRCHAIQGYFHSKPLPAEDMGDYLRRASHQPQRHQQG